MTPASIPHAVSVFLTYVASPAARSLAIAAAVWLSLFAFRVKNVSVRLTAWKLVLCASLAMPLLGIIGMPRVDFYVPLPKIFSAKSTEAALPVAATYGAEEGPSQPTTRVNFAFPRQKKDKNGPVTKSGVPRPHRVALAALPADPPTAHAKQPPRGESREIPWALIGLGIYAAVAISFLLRLLVGWLMGLRLEHAVQRIEAAGALRSLRFAAYSAGLETPPGLAESETVCVPGTLGVLAPIIILPADWREWPHAKFQAILAHEISHVARGDGLMQRLSLLHRAVFWFSPLAWWLDRELSELAEQASDEAALRSGADRTGYAEILLSFFSDLEAAQGRVWWQGVSMASEKGKARLVEQRVEKILAWKGAAKMNAAAGLKIVSLGIAIPLVLLAASLRPQMVKAQGATPPPPAAPKPPAVLPGVPAKGVIAPALPQAPATPAPQAVPMMPSAPTAAPQPPWAPSAPESAPLPALRPSSSPSVPIPAMPGFAPMLPEISAALPARPAVAPSAPLPPQRQSKTPSPSRNNSSFSFTYRSGSNNREEYAPYQAFVMVYGDTCAGANGQASFYGSCTAVVSDMMDHVDALRHKFPWNFIWFRREGKSYVISDAATIRKAASFFGPIGALGQRQDALGRQQGLLGQQQRTLGEQQRRLGEQQAEVHVKGINVSDYLTQLHEVEALLKKLSAEGATEEQLSDIQSQLGDLQAQIGELQSRAGVEQAQIGTKQAALGQQQALLGQTQANLGRQQSALGRQQFRAAHQAARQMKALLDEAMAHGLAKAE